MMRTMRIAVCDDEPIWVEELKKTLQEYANNRNREFSVDEFTSGKELLVHFSRGVFDIIFLDLSMPEIDGIDVAKRIRVLDINVQLVFVTALDEHMQEAFSVMASDYIVKPISYERIETLMSRIESYIKRKSSDSIETFSLKGGGSKSLSLSDILFFQSVGHYIRITTADSEYEYKGKLNEEETRFSNKGFVRTHQSNLVNVAYIYMTFDDHVSLLDGTTIPVSRKYLGKLKYMTRVYRRENT
jgi:DNA-binding LytR/AlgR family response regulator